MFRASDIFGRRPGGTTDRPTVSAKDAGAQKRPLSNFTNREWDPATGKFVEEDLPAEVKAMMGVGKRMKTEVKADDTAAWGTSKVKKELGRGASGPTPMTVTKKAAPSPGGPIDTGAPSVEYRGFTKVELNDRYYEKDGATVHGKPTYWGEDGAYFVYWQGEVQRWAICDVSSFAAVQAGQYPGWAYKEDHRHLSQASGWMEAWNGEWREAEIEAIFRSSSSNKPQWDDQLVQKGIVTVEFKGFTMKELNARYTLRSNQVLQGRPSFWDNSGVYFIYWQQQMGRWALCDLKCIEAVKSGACPGWAYRSDSGHFANAAGWMESRADAWGSATIETAVIGACAKGLKVEFSGFSKQDLNTQFIEKPDEEIQGRVSFWDQSGNFFVYWQASMNRWAICDRASLSCARSGLSPGWAYRTGPQHFAKANSWMEVWGKDWKATTVTCTVLEGTVKGDISAVKAEPKEEPEAEISVEQYRVLVQKIYAEKNPAKLSDVGHLLQKYKDREHELYAQICAKYGVDAEAFVAENASAEAEAEQAEPVAAKEDLALEGEEVPDLSARDYAVLIQCVYAEHNPKKLQDLGRLLQKYRHRERELYLEVCQKYTVHPAVYHAKHQAALGE